MGVQVAKSAAKAQAIAFALLGVLEFGAFAFGPVQGNVGSRVALVLLVPGATWLLASYFASARLEWDGQTLSTSQLRFIHRTVDLRQLARVETKRKLGGLYYVVTDRRGHSVQLPPLLYTRRNEWARALMTAIRASGATTDTEADRFLDWATSSPNP